MKKSPPDSIARLSARRLVLPATTLVACAIACGSTGTDGGTVANAGGNTATSGGATGASGANGLGGDATPTTGGTGGTADPTGGTGGSGATDPVGEVGTLGASCSPPGALACAGNYQKLTLVCSASGTWETNTTCPGTQICDTRPGVTGGSCQEQDPNCLDHSPGDPVCVDNAVHACNADNIGTTLVDACEGGSCTDGACAATDPCPTEDSWLNCATDCGGISDPECLSALVTCPQPYGAMWYWDIGGVVRTPQASAACSCSGSDTRYVGMVLPLGLGPVRVTVGEPWSIVLGPHDPSNPGELVSPCADFEEVHCAVYDMDEAGLDVYAVTDDPGALSRNLRIEEVAEGETCP